MKIFVILSRIPFPLEKGDKLRAYHFIKSLSVDHEVHLCCLTEIEISGETENALNEICSSLYIFRLDPISKYLSLARGLISDKPYQVKYFYQKRIHRKISSLLERIRPDQIFCQLIRTSEYVKNEHDFPKVIDYMDAFSKGIQRRINEVPFYKRVFFKAEYRRLVRYETLIFDYFEKHVIISKPDRNFIYHPKRNEIKVIPNGVQLNYFKPMEMEKKYDLVFTGNMGYPPNINCALFIKEKVLPILLLKRPNVKILIAGAQPSKEVLSLQSNNIFISGWLNDIREAYASAHVFLAPMQIGTGLQNKLLEAMAMKIPCITSSLANGALNAVKNEHILIGNSAKEVAELCIELLDNPSFSKEIGNNGYTFVKENFSWENANSQLAEIMKNNNIV